MRLLAGLAGVLFAGAAHAATWDDCMQNDDMDLKVQACSSVIDASGTSARDRVTATLHRGFARRRLDDVTGALEDVTWVLEQSPRWGHAHYEMGKLMRAQGKSRVAVRSFDIAVRLMSDKAFVWLERGRANAALGNSFAAAQDLDEALRLRPGFAPALRSRALVRCRKGRPEGAYADWTELRGLGTDEVERQARMLKTRGFLSGEVAATVDERFTSALTRFVAAGCPDADD